MYALVMIKFVSHRIICSFMNNTVLNFLKDTENATKYISETFITSNPITVVKLV